jgi:hypothetical protein
VVGSGVWGSVGGSVSWVGSLHDWGGKWGVVSAIWSSVWGSEWGIDGAGSGNEG